MELPDYLWGIETPGAVQRSEEESRFQTTYEELKLRQSSIHYFTPLRASRLPMRNWNAKNHDGFSLVDGFQTTYEELKQSKIIDVDNRAAASRLPMRNWNHQRDSWLEDRHRFQTTYEELKRSKTPVCTNCICCASRLPMRNWNLAAGVRCRWISGSSFQTTYEELKPLIYGGLSPSAWRASRLPMRNWNPYIKEYDCFLGVRLPDYLWGIETIGEEST